jgi:hypothetical protein
VIRKCAWLTHRPPVCSICLCSSEVLKVPAVLGHTHTRVAADLEAFLEAFGIVGFILMEFPSGGVLYQGPAKECRLEDAQHCALSIHMAKVGWRSNSKWDSVHNDRNVFLAMN